MKKFIFFSTLFFSIYANSQIFKTVNITTAGTLSLLLSENEKKTITNLAVSGSIDTRDVKCMRDEISNLTVLDLSEANIQAYTGKDGTNPYEGLNYYANVMPSGSFYFINGGDNGKTSLTTVILPNNLLAIGTYAFTGCTGLISINFPPKLVEIGTCAFAACYKLTTLNLPVGIASLPERVFYNCYGLTSITLPKKLSTIEYGVFYNCTGIKTINSLNPTPPVLGHMGSFGYVKPSAVYVPAASIYAYKSASEWSDFNDVIIPDSALNVYGVTIYSNTGGIITGNGYQLKNGETYNVMRTPISSIDFNINPVPGYEVGSLIYNNIDVKAHYSNSHFITPEVQNNSTLMVTFRKIEYQITIKTAESGSVKWHCNYGDTPSLEITPSQGWKVNTIMYNGSDVTSSLINGIYSIPAIKDNGELNISFENTQNSPKLIDIRHKVYSYKSNIVIEGANNENINIYTTNGKLLQTIKSDNEKFLLPIQTGNTYFIKIGENSFKVIL